MCVGILMNVSLSGFQLQLEYQHVRCVLPCCHCYLPSVLSLNSTGVLTQSSGKAVLTQQKLGKSFLQEITFYLGVMILSLTQQWGAGKRKATHVLLKVFSAYINQFLFLPLSHNHTCFFFKCQRDFQYPPTLLFLFFPAVRTRRKAKLGQAEALSTQCPCSNSCQQQVEVRGKAE